MQQHFQMYKLAAKPGQKTVLDGYKMRSLFSAGREKMKDNIVRLLW